MTSAAVADYYGSGTSPPRWPLLLSIVVLFLSIFLEYVAGNSAEAWVFHGAGWMLATWGAEVSFIVYRWRDRKRRARPDYVMTAWEKPLFAVVTVFCLVVGFYHAVRLAEWCAS